MKFRVLAIAVLSLVTASAQAQQAWTFGKVLQEALANHPLVLGKRSAQDAAQAEREGAEWQRYPTPTLEASTQSGGAGLLRLDQPLWTGGRITAGIDAAGSRLDAAGAALDEARQELALKVIAATTEALRQQARQQHGVAGVKEHEKLLAMIQRRVTQEVSPLADQRLAASRLYASANELSVTTQALNNALAQLTQLAGQPVTAITEQGLSEAGAPAGLDAALTQMLAHSPTLRRLTREEEVADADIASKRAAYMPQLVLRLESSAGQTTDNRAMLVLSAQPGAGLSAKSGVDAAVARREAARLAREAAERDARERITFDGNEWVAARLRLENANQARAMSIEVSESYARQYTTGRKTWIDVLNAVREATQSELAADDARAQMLASSLRLRALTGTLTIASGAVQP
ncbi:MAG: TolC family protein [Burkholderiales bacterium]|nr:TolC family protein [Burkholderiales bacterium]